MANYQTISERDIARGIDARSSENLVPEGYSEDLLNVDTNSNGFLNKRPGYQGYYGYLPIRITQIQHTGTSIILTLDGSIDTTNITATPIVVYGKLGNPVGDTPAGDWSTTAGGQYYTIVSSDTRKLLIAGTNTLTVTESDHGNDTPWLFTQLVNSTSDSTNNNEYFIDNATQIDVSATTYDIDFDYTIPTPADPDNVFALISDKQAVAGTTYTATATLATGVHNTSTTPAFVINAATHNLNNYNILVQVYYNNGASEREKIIPDEVRINATSGLVEIDITNSGASADFYTILSEIGVVNTATGNVTASTTDTIVISTTEPFNYTGVYQSSGGVYTQVIPDSVIFDDSADT